MCVCIYVYISLVYVYVYISPSYMSVFISLFLWVPELGPSPTAVPCTLISVYPYIYPYIYTYMHVSPWWLYPIAACATEGLWAVGARPL